MKSLHEKITFILTAVVYALFHLGKSPSTGSIFLGTLTALASTLPLEIGFTYLIILFIRRSTGGEWPPWDRILRIFFTIGIMFGLIYNLYVRSAIEQERQKKDSVTVSHCLEGDNPMEMLYSA